MVDDEDELYPTLKRTTNQRPSTSTSTSTGGRYYRAQKSGRPATAPRRLRKKKRRKRKNKHPVVPPPARAPPVPLIDLSDPTATFAMGLVHERRRSLRTAKQYYTMASDQGHPRACVHLGLLLEKEDPEKSFQYLLQSAQHTSTIQAKAQLLVGDRLMQQGDTINAYAYFSKSSALGYAVGCLRHAQCFLKGIGTHRSIDAAKRLLEQSAQQEQSEAQFLLANLHEQGLCDCADKQRSDIIAVHWWRKSSQNGFPPAMFKLAKAELNGYGGLHRNEYDAASLFERAATLGHVKAQNAIATCYYQGNGKVQDFKKAAFWYNAAKEQGHLEATANLETMRVKDGMDIPAQFPVELRNYRRLVY